MLARLAMASQLAEGRAQGRALSFWTLKAILYLAVTSDMHYDLTSWMYA